MGQDNPLLLLIMLGAAGYMLKLWTDDYRAAEQGQPNPRALPGATPAPILAIALGAIGGILLLIGETAGEYALGITGEQTKITVLFGVYTLAAAFIEELIFRGYLVIPNKGRAALIGGIIAASFVFAALHPFLWEWKDGVLEWKFDSTKAWFSTAVVFVGSLWFYAMRFMPLNPTQSLLPCFAAHAAKNLGVFAVKYAQGFVSGLW